MRRKKSLKLKEGTISYRDLSLWFGLQPDNFAKSRPATKEKRLRKLSHFCDFHFEGKKLFIDKVHIAEYSSAYDTIEENFSREWGKVVDPGTRQINWQKKECVDTVTRVGKAMYRNYPEVKQVTEKSAISYAGRVKREKVGRNAVKEYGNEGSCRTVYLNKEQDGLLSKEQLAIVRECAEEAYKSVGAQMLQIDEGCAMGDLSPQEAAQLKEQIDTSMNYARYQRLLLERLGFLPKKRTQIEWGHYFFTEKI